MRLPHKVKQPESAPMPRLMATETRNPKETDLWHPAPIRFVPFVLSWPRCRIQRAHGNGLRAHVREQEQGRRMPPLRGYNQVVPPQNSPSACSIRAACALHCACSRRANHPCTGSGRPTISTRRWPPSDRNPPSAAENVLLSPVPDSFCAALVPQIDGLIIRDLGEAGRRKCIRTVTTCHRTVTVYSLEPLSRGQADGAARAPSAVGGYELFCYSITSFRVMLLAPDSSFRMYAPWARPCLDRLTAWLPDISWPQATVFASAPLTS
jgi:hypothetical protein